MAKSPPTENAREKLLRTGSELFRRNGYVAAGVEDICRAAGVTKGAFFHHFPSKEALAKVCLEQWASNLGAMHDGGAFHAVKDPVKKALACMDMYIAAFSSPGFIKSCLAGTTVQEVSETNPVLRDAANACFATGREKFKMVLDEACRARRKKLDTAGLAALWVATIQGSFILYKASRDESVVVDNLRHVREYMRSQLESRSR